MPRMLRHIETGELYGWNDAMSEHKMLRPYDPDKPDEWEHGGPEPDAPVPAMHTAVASTAEDAVLRAMEKAAKVGKVEAKEPVEDDLSGLTAEELAVKQKEAEAELEAALAAENTRKNPPPPPKPRAK